MHLRRFGETDRLPDQTFNPCPQRQVLAFDLLGVAFAWAMHVRGQMSCVRAPRHCQLNEKSPTALFLVRQADGVQVAKVEGFVKEANER